MWMNGQLPFSVCFCFYFESTEACSCVLFCCLLLLSAALSSCDTCSSTFEHFFWCPCATLSVGVFVKAKFAPLPSISQCGQLWPTVSSVGAPVWTDTAFLVRSEFLNCRGESVHARSVFPNAPFSKWIFWLRRAWDGLPMPGPAPARRAITGPWLQPPCPQQTTDHTLHIWVEQIIALTAQRTTKRSP